MAQTLSGRRVLLYFVLFFGVIFAANFYMAREALHTFSGEVNTHPYETGLAYNKVIAAGKRQQALGWKSRITFTPTNGSKGHVHVALTDAQGAVVQGETVTLEAQRPAQEGKDFNVALNAEAGGYGADVTFPLPGLWALHLVATQGKARYETTERVVIP